MKLKIFIFSVEYERATSRSINERATPGRTSESINKRATSSGRNKRTKSRFSKDKVQSG